MNSRILLLLSFTWLVLPIAHAQHVLIKKPVKPKSESTSLSPKAKTKQKTVVANPDKDYDKVLNDDDDCPDEYGPSYNRGCPVDPATFVFQEPAMVYVQGGSFDMGSNTGLDNEKPVHTVNLSSYYICKYEVTVKEFEQFILATNYQTEADKDNGSYVSENYQYVKKVGFNWKNHSWGYLHKRGGSYDTYSCPVVHISWNDAVAYCKWLSEKTGKHYRLPTEAEWEYAAKGGNRSNGYMYSGSNNLESVAWCWPYTSNTMIVGTKQANELGIYDMTGNVFEWCADWYFSGAYAYLSNNGKNISNNPVMSENGSIRVMRGSFWGETKERCQVTFRYAKEPNYGSSYTGFRVVLQP